MTGPRAVTLADLDLSELIRPGDTVLWGQSAAEPTSLTQLLMAQRQAFGPIRCLLGLAETDTCRPEHADVVRFVSYCGSGANRELVRAGVLDVLPAHYSDLPRLFATRRFPIDVLMLLVPPPDPDGRYRLGVANEYLSSAIDGARVVIAEVNDQVPRIGGGRLLNPADVDVTVRVSRPLVEVLPKPPTEVETRIARLVAELVPDRATLQFGLGGLPSAILSNLAGHRDLGVHSGMIVDSVADLAEAGVITNAYKSIDPGLTVAGVLMGSRRLFDFADGQPTLCLRETEYIHSAEILAGQDRLVAINSALEVDLTGQINSESVRGSYIGAIGGAVDFIRGAQRSAGGLPITALPATAGPFSRIVASLSGPASTARSDAGIVVTEYGIADLRGLTLQERQRAMLNLAHPDHREQLEAVVRGTPVTLQGAS